MKANKISLEDLNRLEIEEFKATPKTPLVVVLDDIRSALNVGSFFRTSDAFALKHLYLCGITAKPPHKEILKTAIGATSSVDWSYHESLDQILNDLSEDHTICSIEQTDQSIRLDEFKSTKEHWKNNLCLIFGNEVHGVSDLAISKSDYCIEIPQFGTKHSLNVSVCGGITIWEMWKILQE